MRRFNVFCYDHGYKLYYTIRHGWVNHPEQIGKEHTKMDVDYLCLFWKDSFRCGAIKFEEAKKEVEE